MPLGFTERIVATQEDMMEELRKRGLDDELVAQAAKARQRPWQPGISTGPRYGP